MNWEEIAALAAAGEALLLDLFCCQGGAAKGYRQAGFRVVGIDIAAQPRYPYPFIQADAVRFVRVNAAAIRALFTAVHASPPCQFGSKAQRIQHREHPNLIPDTRAALEDLGLPFVIENVEDARGWLRDPVMLCGQSFGLRTYRHRYFEAGGGFALGQPEHLVHAAPLAKMGRPPRPGEYVHAVGNFSGVPAVRADYGVEWMSRDGIRECIPPAYARHIGTALLQHASAPAVAA